MFPSSLLSALLSPPPPPPPSFMDFPVKICPLISSPLTHFSLSSGKKKQKNTQQHTNNILPKTWDGQLKSMTEQLPSTRSAGVNPEKSNLILPAVGGLQSILLFPHWSASSLKPARKGKRVSLMESVTVPTEAVVKPEMFPNPAGFKESRCPLIGDPAEKKGANPSFF